MLVKTLSTTYKVDVPTMLPVVAVTVADPTNRPVKTLSPAQVIGVSGIKASPGSDRK